MGNDGASSIHIRWSTFFHIDLLQEKLGELKLTDGANGFFNKIRGSYLSAKIRMERMFVAHKWQEAINAEV